MIRAYCKFVDHTRHVEPLVAHRVDQRHARRDQLRQILVAGGNQRVDAIPLRLSGQRSDDVVGLDTVDHQ